jgi:hypothetical protein
MSNCVQLDVLLVTCVVVLVYYLIPVMWHGRPKDLSLSTRITVQTVAFIAEVLIVAIIVHYYFK